MWLPPKRNISWIRRRPPRSSAARSRSRHRGRGTGEAAPRDRRPAGRPPRGQALQQPRQDRLQGREAGDPWPDVQPPAQRAPKPTRRPPSTIAQKPCAVSSADQPMRSAGTSPEKFRIPRPSRAARVEPAIATGSGLANSQPRPLPRGGSRPRTSGSRAHCSSSRSTGTWRHRGRPRADVAQAGGDAELAAEEQEEGNHQPDQRTGDVPRPGLNHRPEYRHTRHGPRRLAAGLNREVEGRTLCWE